jgi:M6 family metalloprotease-like protein
MNPRVGVPLVVALLLTSGWAFTNEEVIDDWVRENQITPESEEEALLGVQSNEHWLVIVVEFPDQKANDAWGISQAQNMMDDTASSYIGQLTNNSSELTITVDSKITTASNPYGSYGMDSNGNRDTNSAGEFLPMKLAEEVIVDHAQSVNWSQFDLDGDKQVDRVLILHTTKGQEETPGQTDKIWSHFTRFESPLKVSDDHTVGHYTMASLRTGSSGMGTVLHEMLHQMGALDLYPVHDSSSQTDWHGVGNFDIMASGNWNGGGSWPALPTSASMELIGVDRTVQLDLTWPVTSVAPCIGPNISMEGMSEGGKAIKIPLSEQQTIWVERHTTYGFGNHLPGQGILVTQQDRSIGDEDRNELNRDPDQPWLAVVEADGQTDMRSGLNDGEEQDLFTNGSKFGADGVLIRDHDGFLVPWTAEVWGDESMSIQFTAHNCTPQFTIDAPDFGAVVLPDEGMTLQLTTVQPCNLTHSLSLSDGRPISLIPEKIENGMTEVTMKFGWNGTANSETRIDGTISCGGTSLDLSTKLLTLSRIPIESVTTGTMEISGNSIIQVPILTTGTGSQSFTVDLDGPLSRVGTVEDRIVLNGEDVLVIEIEPKNLLLDGMKVRGDLVLIDGNGHRWTYELDYVAVDGEQSIIDEWRTPGRILSLVAALFAVWVVTGIVPRKEKEVTPEEAAHLEPQTPMDTNQVTLDPWGRPVDELE